MILVETPKKQPAFWPPKGHIKAHRVTNKDNWWELANHYGRTDPWDIIKYNFETDNPKEVNWFLRELVGCKTSKDGSNYSFNSLDKPGLIYIPPAGWTPGSTPVKPTPGGYIPTADDEALRRSVLNVLGDPNLKEVNFRYRGHRVDWPLLIAVANRIIDRKMGIRYDPSIGSSGEYDPVDNVIFFRFKFAGSDTRRALVVHEAVHAGLDIRKAGELIVSEAEAAAFLAQAIYALEIFPSGEILIGSDGYRRPVYDRAWHIAEQMKAGKKLSELSLEMYALEAAVSDDPEYSATAGNASGYNGV